MLDKKQAWGIELQNVDTDETIHKQTLTILSDFNTLAEVEAKIKKVVGQIENSTDLSEKAMLDYLFRELQKKKVEMFDIKDVWGIEVQNVDTG